jgi:hypothetical protein
MELPSLTSASSQLLTSNNLVQPSNQSPLLNHINTNINVLNHNNNNSNNSKVLIITTAPNTSRTPVITGKTAKMESKIPGTIHTGTTKYNATSTRQDLSIPHEEASTAIPIPGTIHTTKYDETENHITCYGKMEILINTIKNFNST